MSTEEIIEGNKLIAEFMGDDFSYHSDWSWLMPVVEKIEYDLPNDYYFNTNHNQVWFESVQGKFERIDIVQGGRIAATYKSVLQFINYYNNKLK